MFCFTVCHPSNKFKYEEDRVQHQRTTSRHVIMHKSSPVMRDVPLSLHLNLNLAVDLFPFFTLLELFQILLFCHVFGYFLFVPLDSLDLFITEAKS